jgi:hypothetical protein
MEQKLYHQSGYRSWGLRFASAICFSFFLNSFFVLEIVEKQPLLQALTEIVSPTDCSAKLPETAKVPKKIPVKIRENSNFADR